MQRIALLTSLTRSCWWRIYSPLLPPRRSVLMFYLNMETYYWRSALSKPPFVIRIPSTFAEISQFFVFILRFGRKSLAWWHRCHETSWDGSVCFVRVVYDFKSYLSLWTRSIKISSDILISQRRKLLERWWFWSVFVIQWILFLISNLTFPISKRSRLSSRNVSFESWFTLHGSIFFIVIADLTCCYDLFWLVLELAKYYHVVDYSG